MQYIDSFLEPYCVHRPISVASMVSHNLQNSRAFTFPRLRLRMFSTKLGDAQSNTHLIFYGSWKCQQVALCGPFLLSLSVIGVMGGLPTHTIFGFLGPRFLVMALPRTALLAVACASSACRASVSSALVPPRCVFLRRPLLNRGQCRYVAAILASCVLPRAARHRYIRREGLATSSHGRVSVSRIEKRLTEECKILFLSSERLGNGMFQSNRLAIRADCPPLSTSEPQLDNASLAQLSWPC